MCTVVNFIPTNTCTHTVQGLMVKSPATQGSVAVILRYPICILTS